MTTYFWKHPDPSIQVRLQLTLVKHEYTTDGWRDRWRYRLWWKDKLIFDDDCYWTPPRLIRDFVINNILGYLTMRQMDMPEENWESYTPEQQSWTRSDDCEEVALYVYDKENGKES